jgi:hypothetical protein
MPETAPGTAGGMSTSPGESVEPDETPDGVPDPDDADADPDPAASDGHEDS